jgi:hypothetical protein
MTTLQLQQEETVNCRKMKRQIGLKRSFNYEDLASIVESSLGADCRVDDQEHGCLDEKPQQKRMRTSVGPDDRVSTNLDRRRVHHSNARLVSPSNSRDRVLITPDSSPSIKSVNESHTSTFSLSNDECPATTALNRSLLSQRSSLLSDWDTAVFPLEEEKEHHDDDCRWPTFDVVPSPRSLDQFSVRRVTLTSRTCSMMQAKDSKQLDHEVGKLQTAFSLLTLPRSKLEPKRKSRLSLNIL